MASNAKQQLDGYVERFAKALDLSLEVVVRRLTLDSWNRLTKRTPVDTGRARASWAVTISEPFTGPPKLPGEYTEPSAPDVSGIDGTTSVFVSSNVPYMIHLENGHSQQAAQGMVRITIAELLAEIDTILGGINNEIQ